MAVYFAKDYPTLRDAANAAGSELLILEPIEYLFDRRFRTWVDIWWECADGKAKLKRDGSIITTVVGNYLKNDTVINVVDASQLTVGQELAFSTGTSIGSTVALPSEITDINGNQVTIEPLKADVPDGTPTFTVCDLLKGEGRPSARLGNIEFYGNKSNNQHTHDWRINYAMTGFGKIIGIGLHAENSPCETFRTEGGSRITDSTFSDLNGSFAHVTNKTGNPFDPILFDNISGDGVNLASDNGRSVNSPIEFSANSWNTTIMNSDFTGANGAPLPVVGPDDGNLTVINTNVNGTHYKLIRN